MSILKHLGIHAAPPATTAADADSVRRIAQALDSLEPERARQIASLAFVLSRVANADLDISDVERAEMERQVVLWSGLPEAEATLVVEIARRQSILFGGTDNFLVTRELKSSLSHDEKTRLLHCLFAVSAADDSISAPEENIISQIASELGLDHREMVEIRSAYSSKRAVMKDLPR